MHGRRNIEEEEANSEEQENVLQTFDFSTDRSKRFSRHPSRVATSPPTFRQSREVMDEIDQPTGIPERPSSNYRHQQSYGGYDLEGPTAGPANGHTMSLGTFGDSSTIRTRKELGLKPKNALSEQNVHKYTYNQQHQMRASSYQAPHAFPPVMISTDDRRSETSTEASKANVGGVQSTNQREPIPPVSSAIQNEVHKTTVPSDRLMKDQTQKAATTVATPRSQALDLKHNDNAFQVIASLIVDRFDRHLRLQPVSITITVDDWQHLDRVVPDKKRFIDAVVYRLKSCPEHSMKPIHLVTRKCRSLGLDREGRQNILNAAVGSTVRLDVSVRRPTCPRSQ
jgi:hypothetical protein